MCSQLIQSIDIYKKLLDNVSDGIILCLSTGSILWCNNKAADLLMLTKDFIINNDIRKCLPTLSSIITSNQTKGQLFNDYSLCPSLKLKIEVQTLQKEPHFIKAVFMRNITHGNPQDLTGTEVENYKSLQYPVKNKGYRLDMIIGNNRQLVNTKIIAQKAAETSSPILISGETGTGKELFAQGIHHASARHHKPFIAINCGAIPENLLEGIFFGTVKGAYTEAIDRPGLFEQASEGTLFLDEINSMPLSLQVKLLRVLQEKSLRRVGGKSDIQVNPRIISAINIDPSEAIDKTLLRNDLFYRLAVICITIPPLRDRRDDLPALVDHFVEKVCTKYSKPYKKLSPYVLELFNKYDWPGNIRQLEYSIECAINIMENHEAEISFEHLPQYFKVTRINNPSSSVGTSKASSLHLEIENLEKNKIILALEESGGNISQAARILNISRQNLHYRMRKFEIVVAK